MISRGVGGLSTIRLLVVFGGLILLATRPTLSQATNATVTSSNSLSQAPAIEPAATIVLARQAGESGELVAVLREALEHQGLSVRFLRERDFKPSKDFTDCNARPGLWVLVDAYGHRSCRLYFRGPSGERFLIREIQLRNGLDEVGRELIAQIVESSMFALMHTGAGMTCDEARENLAKQSSTASPSVIQPPSGQQSSRAAKLRGWVGLGYVGMWTGPDTGLDQGPVIELGSRSHGSVLVGARFNAERYFRQTIRHRELDSTVQDTALRLSLDVGRPIGSHLLAVSIGGGVDVVRIEPGVPRSAGVTPSSARTNLVPVLRPALRYEISQDVWTVAFLLFADVSIVHTRTTIWNGAPSGR